VNALICHAYSVFITIPVLYVLDILLPFSLFYKITGAVVVGRNCNLLSVDQTNPCSVVLSVGKNSTVVSITVPVTVTWGIVLNVRRR